MSGLLMRLRLAVVALAVLAAAGAGGGCVQGFGTEPMCLTDDDCDSGEICGDGICFGNPPDQRFAATLHPPPGRPDLAVTEVPTLEILGDGTLTNVRFGPAITLRGQIMLHGQPTSSLPARVVFRRTSAIPGGGDVRISTDAIPQEPGEPAFEVVLAPGEYEISVYPDDGTIVTPTDGSPTAAELAPPKRIVRTFATDTALDIELGDASGLQQIAGRIVRADGSPVVGARVRAYGRFANDRPLELASSVARTGENGEFVIAVPISWQETFDVVVTPRESDRLPTLTLKSIEVPDPVTAPGAATEIGVVTMPTVEAAEAFSLSVVGSSPSGGFIPAQGAIVTLRTELQTGTIDAFYETSGITDTEGDVVLTLIPAQEGKPRRYTATVLPPPEATLAAAWDLPLEVGRASSALPPIELEGRTLLTGELDDFAGGAVGGMTVRPRPSASLLAELTAAERALLGRWSLPERATDPFGRFSIYLDPTIMGRPAVYDLELVPPVASLLPRWTIEGVGIEAEGATQELPPFTLPDVSYARGAVFDRNGFPVPGAELRVYVVDDACVDVAPAACAAPVLLRALTKGDEVGNVRLALPAP